MPLRPLTLPGFIGLFLIAGCAVPTEGPAPEDTAADEAAATAMRFYECRGSFSDDTLTRVEVGLGGSKIEVTDLSKDAAPPDTGRLDPSYRPTPTFAGAIRFDGFDKLEESFSGDVAHVEIIVSKELKLTGATQGKLWVRGSGGDSTQYFCRATAAKLKVDLARKSRLFCNLSPISCTNDNPPGDTCLADLFISQTAAGSATLRETFLDHFGVHAQSRRETIGASTSLSRTKKTIKGTWNDNELDLDYRGGVTYTGTFKLPDGSSNKVQCNDLAMFD